MSSLLSRQVSRLAGSDGGWFTHKSTVRKTEITTREWKTPKDLVFGGGGGFERFAKTRLLNFLASRPGRLQIRASNFKSIVAHAPSLTGPMANTPRDGRDSGRRKT